MKPLRLLLEQNVVEFLVAFAAAALPKLPSPYDEEPVLVQRPQQQPEPGERLFPLAPCSIELGSWQMPADSVAACASGCTQS